MTTQTDPREDRYLREFMDMRWESPELKRRFDRNLAELMRNRKEHPDLYGPCSLPFKMLTEGSVHGIQRRRLIWLKENHPQAFREMLASNTLEDHLREIEDRTRARYAQIMDDLMLKRGLLNRQDVREAHPEITDADRYRGTIRARDDAMRLAIDEVVESF